jgi:hypothetical protein
LKAFSGSGVVDPVTARGSCNEGVGGGIKFVGISPVLGVTSLLAVIPVIHCHVILVTWKLSFIFTCLPKAIYC